MPTFRDPDGLAASSRNRYLSAPERTVALTLPAALEAGRARAGDGPQAVLAAARAVLDPAPLTADYLALVDAQTFEPGRSRLHRDGPPAGRGPGRGHAPDRQRDRRVREVR